MPSDHKMPWRTVRVTPIKPSSYLNDSICQGSSLPVSRLRYWIGSIAACCRPVCKTMFTINGLNTSGLAFRPEMNSEISVRSRDTLARLPVAGGPCCSCGIAATCSVSAMVGATMTADAQATNSAAVPPWAASRRNDLRLITEFDVLGWSMHAAPPARRCVAARSRFALRKTSVTIGTTPKRCQVGYATRWPWCMGSRSASSDLATWRKPYALCWRYATPDDGGRTQGCVGVQQGEDHRPQDRFLQDIC